MGLITKSFRAVYTSAILRKVVHTIFSLLLIIPFMQWYRDTVSTLWPDTVDPTLITLSILLFGAALVNSIQIRIPNLRDKFMRSSVDVRRKIIEGIENMVRVKPYTEVIEGFIRYLAKYEEKFLEFMSIIERDYELKYGYVCITFALLSITMSYVLFGYRAVYGVLALAVVDSVSSIVTLYTTNRRKILKHSDLSIAVTFTIFTLIVYTISTNFMKSLAISAIAIAVELLSPEDNLTLPIATTLMAYVFNVQIPKI